MPGAITVGDMGEIAPDTARSEQVARLWMDVANDGGAVGFPVVPVDISTVREAVQAMSAEIELGRRTVIGARVASELVGWVSLTYNLSPLTAHWAKLQHLQSHPTMRGQGIGAALLAGAVEHARSLRLEQLILTVRGGENLEPFYERHGWHEIGRQVGALRFADNDDRDEVLMAIALS